MYMEMISSKISDLVDVDAWAAHWGCGVRKLAWELKQAAYRVTMVQISEHNRLATFPQRRAHNSRQLVQVVDFLHVNQA